MFTGLKNRSIFDTYPELEKRYLRLVEKLEMIESFPNSQELNQPMAWWWDEYLSFRTPELLEEIYAFGERVNSQELPLEAVTLSLETYEKTIIPDYKRFLDFKGRLEEEDLEFIEDKTSYAAPREITMPLELKEMVNEVHHQDDPEHDEDQDRDPDPAPDPSPEGSPNGQAA